MSATKSTLVVTLVSLFVIAGPLTAFANDTDSDSNPSHTHGTKHQDGDNDNDDKFHGLIPPVFVIPGQDLHRDHKDGQKPVSPKPTTPGASGTPTPPDAGTNSNTTVGGLSLGGTQAPSGPAGTNQATATDLMVVNANDPKSQGNVTQINPKFSAPVQINSVRPSRLTPEDEFMYTAYIGMIALAVAAVGLSVTAGVRAIRLRKSDKNDYFYEN